MFAGRDAGLGPALIQDQLAAPTDEGAQAGIVGVEDLVGRRIGLGQVAVEVQRLRIPVRILEDDVLEVVHGVADRHRRPPQLAAPLEAREDLLARPRVRRARRTPACTASTCGAVRHEVWSAPAAGQDARIEATRERILDHAVRGAVVAVARGQGPRVNRRQLLLRVSRRDLRRSPGRTRSARRPAWSCSWPARRRRRRRSRRDSAAPPSAPAARPSSSR